jgi:hypothetical protein
MNTNNKYNINYINNNYYMHDIDDNNKGIQTKEDFFLNEIFRDVNKYATILKVKKIK